jgi:hypothetical protein
MRRRDEGPAEFLDRRLVAIMVVDPSYYVACELEELSLIGP